MIEVRGLTKRYHGASTSAVDGISFTAEAGQFFALLGPNGAGKTTTISILTTTLAPTGGEVRVAGHDLRREAAAVRKAAGIIFQRPSLDQNLSGEENVRFHAVLYGLHPWRPTYGLMPAAYKRDVSRLAGILHIEESINRPVRTYSGGMRRKLEIVRSLLHRPRVLFLDEPTSGLDVASRRDLWEYLRQVRRDSGTTILLTTHYLEEAEEADAICIIDRGRIVAEGSPSAVKARLVQEYVLVDASDRPALRAELDRRGIAYDETDQIRIPLAGRTVHALLRGIETPLTRVTTHTPTLEDAYLEIIGAGARETAA
ncbi:MAG: ABC transporter ATP-binding protein [Chloroflexi bacterium]|nr:ABC transporter ATP-binding protein [Chloroflexota bacterium]